MDQDNFKMPNGFSLFYDQDKVIPMLNVLGELGFKIKQLIWNKAYDHSLADFKSCGKNQEYKFFIVKNPSLKISYRDYRTHWIVYSITPV